MTDVSALDIILCIGLIGIPILCLLAAIIIIWTLIDIWRK